MWSTICVSARCATALKLDGAFLKPYAVHPEALFPEPIGLPVLKGLYNFRDTRIAMLRAETQAELVAILDHIERDILTDPTRRIVAVDA